MKKYLMLPLMFALSSCSPGFFSAVDTVAVEEQSCKVEIDKEMLQKDVNYHISVDVVGPSSSPVSK